MKEEDIQYISKLLEDPTLLQTEKFKEWIQEEDHREHFWNAKAALDNSLLQESHLPELKKNWQRLSQSIDGLDRPMQKGRSFNFRQRNGVRWGAAAAILLLLGWGISTYLETRHSHTPIPLVKALPFPQNITLQNSIGDTLLLSQRDTVYAPVKDKRSRMSYHTIQTPRGKEFKVTLSDGTEVHLNSESSLRYPISFNGNERVVELSGEAYFNVAKDDKKPFIVKTERVHTKVLGTGFNLRAYPNQKIHVTLVEGSIAVAPVNSQEMRMLNPGEDACFVDESGTMEVQNIDVRRFTAWTSGYFFFEDTSLEDIMRELGCWYNVNVEFVDPEVMQYHFNFWVNRNQDIKEALTLLQQVNKVKILFRENTVTIL